MQTHNRRLQTLQPHKPQQQQHRLTRQLHLRTLHRHRQTRQRHKQTQQPLLQTLHWHKQMRQQPSPTLPLLSQQPILPSPTLPLLSQPQRRHKLRPAAHTIRQSPPTQLPTPHKQQQTAKTKSLIQHRHPAPLPTQPATSGFSMAPAAQTLVASSRNTPATAARVGLKPRFRAWSSPTSMRARLPLAPFRSASESPAPTVVSRSTQSQAS